MKTAMTITDVINASESCTGSTEIALDELAAVYGGSGGVPYNTPQSAEYEAGRAQAQSGHDLFVQGSITLIGSTALPPPVDLAVGGYGAYQMVDGAGRMDQGQAMMEHAQASYDASQAAPPPPTVVTIDPVTISGSDGHMENGVMMMEPLVVSPGGDGGGDY
jgi:hypothetical protein